MANVYLKIYHVTFKVKKPSQQTDVLLFLSAFYTSVIM